MKKIIALLLALVMVFALVACSSKTTDDTAKDDTTTPADTTETTDNTGDTADTADNYRVRVQEELEASCKQCSADNDKHILECNCFDFLVFNHNKALSL